MATHGTSAPLAVTVQGRDVEANLRFIASQFKEGKTVVGALSQLAIMLRSLQPFPVSRTFNTQLWSVMASARDQLNPNPSRQVNKHQLQAIQSACASVCLAALTNRFVITCFSGPQRAELSAWYSRYCPFRDQFFVNEQEKKEYYATHWKFQPADIPTAALPTSLYQVQFAQCYVTDSIWMIRPSPFTGRREELLSPPVFVVVQILTKEVENLLPQLLPTDTFFHSREEVRGRLEAMLAQVPLLPRGNLSDDDVDN